MFFFAGLGIDIVQASTIAVDRLNFTARGESGSVSSDFLKISNISSAPQQYRLAWRPVSAGDNEISIMPTNFVLGPAEEKNLVLRFRQGSRSGRGEIELAAYDLDKNGDLQVASGVKIPVQFIIPQALGAKTGPGGPSTGGGEQINFWTAGVYLFDLLLALVVFWLYGYKIKRVK